MGGNLTHKTGYFGAFTMIQLCFEKETFADGITLHHAIKATVKTTNDYLLSSVYKMNKN